MTIGARLKEWRAAKNLSQKDASSISGVSFSTYQNYEMDISPPGAKSLTGFISAGINANWLMTGEGPMLLEGANKAISMPKSIVKLAEILGEPITAHTDDPFALIPFYDVEASAGHGSLVDQELQLSQMAFRKDWLALKGLQADKCALIKAKGDSMEPTIHDGDLLLVDISIDTIKDDSIYIVQTDHHLIVKRIQQDWDGSLIVISDNPRYEKRIISAEQAKEVKIAGRVRWYGHEI